MENECLECGSPCVNDLCEDCMVLDEFDHVHEADNPPDHWYADWNSYAEEYE